MRIKIERLEVEIDAQGLLDSVFEDRAKADQGADDRIMKLWESLLTVCKPVLANLGVSFSSDKDGVEIPISEKQREIIRKKARAANEWFEELRKRQEESGGSEGEPPNAG